MSGLRGERGAGGPGRARLRSNPCFRPFIFAKVGVGLGSKVGGEGQLGGDLTVTTTDASPGGERRKTEVRTQPCRDDQTGLGQLTTLRQEDQMWPLVYSLHCHSHNRESAVWGQQKPRVWEAGLQRGEWREKERARKAETERAKERQRESWRNGETEKERRV